MSLFIRLLPVLVIGAVVGPARAELPLVAGADSKLLRADCQRLLQALDALKAPLPRDTARAVQSLLKDGARKPEAVVAEIQKLLDRHCLVGVTINPESRVKVARGPAAAALILNRETVVLIKVHNEAGVTQGLKVDGPQLRSRGQDGAGRWLEAVVHTERPLRKTLSGHLLEYVVLGLTAREAGKREATLRFDVGQGTQDLGFRAEVPVLFKIQVSRR